MGLEPHGGGAPSAWIQRFAHLIPAGGRVLDLACGRGRHARYLSQRGCSVLAVDRDATALEALAGTPGVDILRADLENAPWPLGGERFDGVVVTNYLHRPLLPLLSACLVPDGALLYETFMLGNERFGRPSNPDFLLQPGELWDAFSPVMQVVAFEQGLAGDPPVAAVQRLAAVGPQGLPRLA